MKALCKGKQALIWPKASSWGDFLYRWRFYNLGISHHSIFQLLQYTQTWNYEWQGIRMLHGCWFASFDDNYYHNKLQSICVSLIIWTNFCWVKIPNWQLNDSHTWSSTTATVPSQTQASQWLIPTLWPLNATFHAWKWLMQLQNNQNTKKRPKASAKYSELSPIRPPSKVLGKYPSTNENPWTTLQLVHSILTTTNLQPCSNVYSSHSPKNPRLENLHCDYARCASHIIIRNNMLLVIGKVIKNMLLITSRYHCCLRFLPVVCHSDIWKAVCVLWNLLGLLLCIPVSTSNSSTISSIMSRPEVGWCHPEVGSHSD